MDPLSAVSLALAVIGTAGTIYFGFKAQRLERRIRRFDWDDVLTGVKTVSKQVSRDSRPDLMLSVSGPGSIVSNLLLTETSTHVPLYVAISQRADETQHPCRPHYRVTMQTTKWRTYIPDDVFAFKDKRILVCDDCVLSGDTMAALTKVLVDNGFERRNITTMALFVTDVARSANKAPDFFWFEVPDSDFYLPWGRSLGRGF